MNYLTLGPVPAEESCQQVGTCSYDGDKANLECQTYKQQLLREFPPPSGATIRVKIFPHDFGSYKEVCVVFNENDEEAVDYAYHVESNLPANWDEVSKLRIQDLRIGTRW